MSSTPPRVVGILAGGGSLPREIAERVVARGDRVQIVAIAGEGGGNFAPFPATEVSWAQIGAMVRTLKNAGCTELVIVGSVRRPDLTALRPDMGFFRNLPAILRIIAAGGDDSVLTRVVRFFEEKGFHVVAPAAVVPELLVREGSLGRLAATPAEAADVALGFEVVRRLGPYDVGQAVVVADGRVAAIEDAGGTDAMLGRLQRQRHAGGAATKPKGVLVKRPKPGQELRIDLPAIGPDTVQRAVDAGLAGIAVLAAGTLAAERAELARRADASGLFVQGFKDAGATAPERRPDPAEWVSETLGKRAPTASQHTDATTGAALLSALTSLAGSHGTVVDRGHVLAVECGEGAAGLIERVGALRQWGRRGSRRRSGIAVLSAAEDLHQSIRGAGEAGLAGLALLGHPPPAHGAGVREADRLGLVLLGLAPARG